MLFEKIKHEVLQTGANVFRIALYEDGIWHEETLRQSCPCLNSYSLSKNFTATAIGIAQDMGLLSVEDTIIKYFPKKLPKCMDDKLERVKIKHLLTQTMGNMDGYLFEKDRYTYDTDDWIRLILSKPLAYEPGEMFVYSNSTFYLLSCIIHKVSGMTMVHYLKNHLFRYMGIQEFAWETCPRGETMGATGLYMSTSDIAKLGVLYLNFGQYEGRQLISQQWVQQATKMHSASADGIQYGFSFWINNIGYHGGGAYNQVILVIPEKKLVFAAHSYTEQCDFINIVSKCL